MGAVIYAAVVGEAVEGREYFAAGSEFAGRPDCIYEFHRQNGTAAHNGRSRLHRGEAHLLKDLGRYPFYRNGRVLVSREFRYFGAAAVKIPARLHLLAAAADALGQGHRVYTERDAESREADALFRLLWRRETRFTPTVVDADAYERHGGAKVKAVGVQCR